MAVDRAILVCTVGGSHQPILTALKARHWDRVVFVCTEGAAGSSAMVETGVVVSPQPARERGVLPPIPVQAGLDRDRWEMVPVPADNPDDAFQKLACELHRLAAEHPAAELIADYTGGTKSMSVALFLAALEAGASPQLTTGERVDLVRVRDATEAPVRAESHRIADAREFARLAAGWGRFAYQEAAEGFARLWASQKERGASRDETRRSLMAKELSHAFAAWDRFDHRVAASRLKDRRYDAVEIDGRNWRDIATGLARNEGAPWGALHLRDLWHNAQRCAARGRFDDAVARLYRMWEATAQWLLRVDFGVAASVFDVGLKKSWDLYRHLQPTGEAAAFWERATADGQTEWARLDERLKVRNHSIWAHGFDAVGEAGWNRLSQWTETGLLEVLAHEALRLGEPHELPQLPTALPEL
jgi:CRISPR-associated protein (TIGR02710 family)